MKYFWFGVSLVLLGVILLEVALGEAAMVRCAIDTVKAPFTGRMPLRDWSAVSPVSFYPFSGRWSFVSVGEYETSIFHPVGWDGNGKQGVKALELDLGVALSPEAQAELAKGELDYQILVELRYLLPEAHRETEMLTFPILEFASADKRARRGGFLVELVVPVNPTRRLDTIYLWVEGESLKGGGWLDVYRAELILR